MAPVSAFQDDDVEQPPRLELNEVATGKPTDVVIKSDCSRLNQEEGRLWLTIQSPNPLGPRLTEWILGLEGCLRL